MNFNKRGIFMLRKLLAFGAIAALAVVFAVPGCTSGETEKKPENEDTGKVTHTETYTTIEKTIENEARGWEFKGIEVLPADYEEGDKIPTVILVHGGTSTEQSLLPIAKKLAEKGIAGYTFACHGALPGTDLYSSHYTSRISDLEAAIAYINTRDYVDKDKMYLLGESYGGIVVSFDIVRHANDYDGLILVSTGITDDILTEEGKQGYLAEYDPEDPWEYIKGYSGDIVGICGNEDTNALANMEGQMAVYKEREGAGRSDMYVVDGGHGFSSFTAEAQDTAIDYMCEIILD